MENELNYYNSYLYLKCINIYVIIALIIFESPFYKDYNFCLMCAEIPIKDNKCNDCPFGYIFRGLKILSREKTLHELIINNKSITRYGDGEYRIIFGENAGLQKYDKTLSKKLRDILKCNEKNLLIGINIPYRKKDLNERSNVSKTLWKSYFGKNKLNLARIINKKKIYYSSLISRFYSTFVDKSKSLKYIMNFKKIWVKEMF